MRLAGCLGFLGRVESIIAYSVTTGEWVQQDKSYWQFSIYGEEDFFAGRHVFDVPALGEYWFFIRAVSWDNAQISAFTPAWGLAALPPAGPVQ